MAPGRLKLGAQVLAVAFVAALLALLAWKLISDEGGEAARGVAPAFDLPRLDREGSLSLASLRGKAVVLNFWASWCEPCKDEAAVLERTWQRYRGRDLVVVGVDANDFRGDARKFARRYGMTYPLVHDTQGEWLDDYGVVAFPETYFIDRAGRIVGERIQGPVDGSAEVKAQYERGIALALGE